MARALRIEYSGALYHVTSRGDRREDIYDDDVDRASFLSLLNDVCESYNWDCHGYCLMSNHYHLLIETVESNLSAGMRQLNGVYSQKYNNRHNKVGHVFQGRYTSILVEKESYLLELTRYIVLNPVRAKMVARAAEWPWSSYRAVIGKAEIPSCLNRDWILSCFGSNRRTSIKRYIDFVLAGKYQGAPWVNVKNKIFLGTDKFVEHGLKLIDDYKDLSEVPRIQRRSPKRSLVHYAETSTSRNDAIMRAYKSGGYTMKEVGEFFGLGYSMVSRIVRNSQFKT
jgi:putative transposase